MNATVVFTKYPADYTDIIEKTDANCTLVTDETMLTREILHRRPFVVMIESDENTKAPFSFGDYLQEDSFPPPAIVYGNRDLLKKFLTKASSLTESFSPYEIPDEFNRKLDKALMEFHFSPSLRGYHYLKQAFYYEALNARQISAVKKDIYEAVSNCYCTSIYSVERGITFSIRKAFQKNPEKFSQIFSQTKAPSNMQFLKTFLIYLKQSGLF